MLFKFVNSIFCYTTLKFKQKESRLPLNVQKNGILNASEQLLSHTKWPFRRATVLLFVVFFTMGAGLSSISIDSHRYEAKSTDLIFSSGFESIPSIVTLSSEAPFSGSLPALETGSETVGFTPGSFNVNQTGQASYSIPILAGAGAAGVVPQISLEYSSTAGNGHVGVGWFISGTTLISRCRETEESKGSDVTITPLSITYGVEDKFCLNGERLFVSNNGVYGVDGTEYRTEKDQFARITSYGGSNNNPDYFTIERKDGSISFYGNTVNSTITVTSPNLSTNGKTYLWTINRYEDTMGNYINYRYNKFANAEFVLTNIDYTGNSSTGLSPPNNIRFSYEARNDEYSSHLGGAAFGTTQRLAQIRSRIGGSLAREYTLVYEYSGSTSKSLLTAIQECRSISCLPATTFNWSIADEQFNTSDTGTAQSFPKNVKSSKQGDINADGRADLIFVDDDANEFKVALANGQVGFVLDTVAVNNITVPTGSEIDNKWHLLDYNADGRQDLLLQSGSQWVIHLANLGTLGFSNAPTFIGVTANDDSDFQIVDVNGDGLADLLYSANNQLSVRYLQRQAEGSSYGFSSTAVILELPANPADISGLPVPSGASHMSYRFYQDDNLNVIANDVNGDGVADLILRSDVYQGEQKSASYKFLSAGEKPHKSAGSLLSSHWVAFIGKGLDADDKLNYYSESYYIKQASSLADSAGADIKFIDINADGLTDVIAKNTTNNWQFRLATGKGFGSFTNITSISNEKYLQLVDYNLDGFVDLVYPVGDRYRSKNWTGESFSSSAIDTNARSQDLNRNSNMFVDLNGDGNIDHIRIDSDGKQRVYPRMSSYVPTDRITTFTNGMGTSTDVLYRPMTFSNTYTQGDYQTTAINYGQGSPVLDLMGAIYVVRQVDTHAPVENNESLKNTVRYRYKNGKVQTGGRGFLGFEQVIFETPVRSGSSHDVKILETTTTYRQDFPYNGMPASTEVRQLNESFYATNKVQLDCNGYDDSCFPPPCGPGFDCQSDSQKSANTLLSKVENEFNQLGLSKKNRFPYIGVTSRKTYSPETGVLLKTERETSTHDNYGNPLVHTVTTEDADGTVISVVTTVNSYSNITTDGKWLIGLLESSSITKTLTGQPSNTSVTEFDYDVSTGMVIEERRDPTAGVELFLRTLYQYDSFGNNIKTTVCSGDTLSSNQCRNNTPIPATSSNPYHIHRYNRVVYDSRGRYVEQTFNTLEQKLSEVTARDIYGNPVSSVDILGQTTTNNYDIFGRLTSTRNNTGVWSQTSRSWCSSLSGLLACPEGLDLQFRIRKLDAGGKASYVYMDGLGREVATITRTFNANNDPNTSGDDRYVLNKIWHDQFGRKVKSEGDHFLGASSANIPILMTELDNYNRSNKFILPDNTSETIEYSGLVTVYSNDRGQRKHEIRNALGQLTRMRDFDEAGDSPNYKNSMSYEYNSQGALKLVTRDADGVIERLIENEHDLRGRKISSDDVDFGFNQFFYNALGEVVETIDSEDNSIKTYFDELGRGYQTESWKNTTILTRNINSYNNDSGLLESEAKQTFAGGINFTKNHSYDAYNRTTTTDVSFTDVDNVCSATLCNYQAQVFYDQYSRLKYQQDVSGKSIQNHYNSIGYLSHVTDAFYTSTEYYRINKTDKWGNVTNETKAGNPALTTSYTFHSERGWLNSINSIHQSYTYEYDTLGNLDKRLDVQNNQSECFLYDRLNRLTDSYRYSSLVQECGSTSGNTGHQPIDYDAKGNIISKDGQNYSYLNANQNNVGVSPHQVQTKGSQNFSYDNRGNLTLSTNFKNGQNQLVNRNISYTGFNKIDRIHTTAGSSTAIVDSQYRYDNSENRYSRADTNQQGGTTVIHFMGNVEVKYTANGQLSFKRHLGNYAIIIETNQSTQETYLFHDHIGSVDAIIDSRGNLLQKMSFSAWGERRLPANWDIIPTSSARNYLTDYTTKGFTGHEMLDAFGIINMGGRIYDAVLGRMLQADPVIMESGSSQSYNRYSYAGNNPLSFTDPTGYIHKKLRRLIAVVVAVVIAVYAPALLNAFWTAFASGFAGTFIMTGNLKASLKAGIISGAVAFAGGQLTANDPAGATTAGSSTAAGGAGGTISQTAASSVTPTVTSASTNGVVASSISAGDIALQVVANLDPRAARIISLMTGGGIFDSAGQSTGFGSVVTTLAASYGKFRAGQELEQFAIKNGMSYAELTMAMTAISFGGNELVGSRYNSSVEIKGEDSQMMFGMFSRQEGGWLADSASSPTFNKILGSPFDVVDVVLGYAGILTASDYDFINSGKLGQKLIGHSLGTLGVSNIINNGYLDAGMGELYSLPFGNIAPAGSTLFIGEIDIVNGFFFGGFLNPTATIVSGCLHPFDCYVKNTNSVSP